VPGAGGIRAGRAFIELFVEDGKINPGLQRALTKMRGFANSLTAVGKQIGAVGLGIVAALGGAVKKATDFGSSVADLSQRVGITAETASQLAYAAEQSATSIDTLEVGLRNMQKTVVGANDGNKQAAAALDAIGLSARQLSGLSPEQRLLMIAEALRKIEDPGVKSSAAMRIFGKAGAELVPLLDEGASGIKAMMQRAVELNLVMSTDSAATAKKLGDQLNTLQNELRSIVVAIGTAVIPALSDAAKALEPLLAKASQWIGVNGNLILTLGEIGVSITVLGTLFTSLGAIINGTVGTITTLVTVVKNVIPVLRTLLYFIRANPWTAAAAAVAAAGAAYMALREDAMAAQDAVENLNKARDESVSSALPVADRVAGPNPAEQGPTPAQISQRDKVLAYAKEKAARENPDWMAAAQAGIGDTLRNVSNALGGGLRSGVDAGASIARALENALSKASQTVGSTTAGTFNGMVAAQALSVNSPEKEIAQNTKDTADAVTDLTAAIKNFLPSFT